MSSEALCGRSRRELEIPADSRSSRRVCSFLHPQYLEKCLAYKMWLIHAGQKNGHGSKCSIQPGSVSSANVNALSLWCLNFIELSLLQAQTNISHSVRKRKASIFWEIWLHPQSSPLVCPTSPTLFTYFHFLWLLLLLVVVFLCIDPAETSQSMWKEIELILNKKKNVG